MMSRTRDTARRLGRTLAGYAPTRRAALVILLTAPVWLLSGSVPGIVAATLVATLVALAVLADALLLPGPGAFTVRRHAPEAIGLGACAAGRCTIASRWMRPILVTLVQAPPDEVRVAPTRATTDVVPGSEAVLPFELEALRRGVVPLGPVALIATGPIGLVRRTLRYALDDTVTVLPALPAARQRLAAAQHLRRSGERVQRRRGGGTSFSRLREYAPGDDPRHVDWKATARHGRLISREYTVERGQTVIIAIDAGRMMTQLAGDHPRFEYALTAALALAGVALAAGDSVGLLVFDAEVRRWIPPERGPETMRRFRDALVGVTPTMAEPDYAGAFRTLVERQRRRALVVLFTDVVDVRASRALVALTARSAERHLPLVVALRNAQLAAAAVPSGAADADTLRAAAAEELLQARDAALASMRLAGVSVLDVEPTAMAAALVDRYLEIKERAVL